jgi:hypothetical protein
MLRPNNASSRCKGSYMDDSLRPLVSVSPGRAPQFDGHAVFVSRMTSSTVIRHFLGHKRGTGTSR